VRMGSMRSTVKIADVRMDSHRAARRAKEEAAQVAPPDADAKQEPGVVLIDGVPAGGRVTARTIDSTLDLRGQRVDDAVAQVDRFVDESLMAGRDAVFLVHGHGTGALRSAIRTHLATHKGIEKQRAGEPSEGGDGVTVAFLR